jgi:hypothetical protein
MERTCSKTSHATFSLGILITSWDRFLLNLAEMLKYVGEVAIHLVKITITKLFLF